jgi:hypothetical protein
MQKLVFVSLVSGALVLALLVPRGASAPALADHPPKYEYAELQVTLNLVGPPMMAPRVGFVPPVNPGPGLPPAMPAVGAVVPAVRWTTAEEQVEGKDWEEFADKLKAPVSKKEIPLVAHKLRALNRLSELGWEMLDRPVFDGGAGSLAFRRRLP